MNYPWAVTNLVPKSIDAMVMKPSAIALNRNVNSSCVDIVEILLLSSACRECRRFYLRIFPALATPLKSSVPVTAL